MALCVPEEYGGHGAGFETYCLVAEQLAQGNAATALTFNMHCLVMLMMGPFMEGLELPPDVQARHQFLSAKRYREVVEQGVFYGQPHSEPIESGDQDQLTVGGRRFGGTWEERRLYLSIPRDAPGLEFTGDWDPVGMRSTVSRDMSLNNVRATEDAEVLPPGVFGQLYQRQPHIFISFSATFLGLMQAAYDYTVAYLTGRAPGVTEPRSEASVAGNSLAEMLFTLESTRALFYRAISEQRLDPTVESVQRARAAHVQVQRAVVEITGAAMRVCGGRAMLKRHPLERYYRDARASAVMRPWTQDHATRDAWMTVLES